MGEIYQIEVTGTHWRNRQRRKGTWELWSPWHPRSESRDQVLIEIICRPLEGRGVVAYSGAAFHRLMTNAFNAARDCSKAT